MAAIDMATRSYKKPSTVIKKTKHSFHIGITRFAHNLSVVDQQTPVYKMHSGAAQFPTHHIQTQQQHST